MSVNRRSVLILGTRGIPAAHGGFETFAERLALHLVDQGWEVGVYCQRELAQVRNRFTTDVWSGIERIHVEVAAKGPRATLEFDWYCVRHAAKRDAVCLVLGYNSGIFLPYLRAFNRPIVTNMDGIEWRRPKWSRPVKAWFWINEWIAAWSSHRLIADHPRIADHLASRRSRGAITMIPYGGDAVTAASDVHVRALGLEPDRYIVSIARLEPDNNIDLIVKAFSTRRRNAKLVVLGDLLGSSDYHLAIQRSASDEVIFTGGIYERDIVKALRFHARAYIHGHSVGGTNPSLVEALWAGNAVIAHDNPYNRWTAGDAGLFFDDLASCEHMISNVFVDDSLVASSRVAARARATNQFDWTSVFQAYVSEFLTFVGPAPAIAEPDATAISFPGLAPLGLEALSLDTLSIDNAVPETAGTTSGTTVS